MATLVAVVDKMVIAVRLDHSLAESVELGDEMHGGGVLVPIWPERFTVVEVSIPVNTPLLIVVNDGNACWS